MRCSVAEVKTAILELRTGKRRTGSHHESFSMWSEQAAAVEKTHSYFHSVWQEDMHAVPRFLWNAKMRFGKTFAAYRLTRKLGATRILVVTFEPAARSPRIGDVRRCRGISDGRPRRRRRQGPAKSIPMLSTTWSACPTSPSER